MRPGSRAVRAGTGLVCPLRDLRDLRDGEQVDSSESVVRPTARR
ncbi:MULTISPECIES: hypothetical protein [unclassified Streptomyces]|nr:MULTISPECIES: hypothetical protein [unclassified Streptomyces]